LYIQEHNLRWIFLAFDGSDMAFCRKLLLIVVELIKKIWDNFVMVDETMKAEQRTVFYILLAKCRWRGGDWNVNTIRINFELG
jgi:hypothetical protein